MSNDQTCHGKDACRYCGMDMDLEPYCVEVNVMKRRTAETGRDYPIGLDIGKAWPLCQGDFWSSRVPK